MRLQNTDTLEVIKFLNTTDCNGYNELVTEIRNLSVEELKEIRKQVKRRSMATAKKLTQLMKRFK